MAFIVGHSAYSGANRQKHHKSYAATLADLLARKVSMKQAHKKMTEAKRGSFVVCSNKRGDVIELVYRDVCAAAD